MAKILGQDASGLAMLFVIVMVGFLAALVAASYLQVLPSGGGVVPGTVSGGGVPTINLQQVCGADGLGNVNFRAKNDGNLTATEWTGDVLYVYQIDSTGKAGQLVGTITSGATSAYVQLQNIACGQKLVGYVLSTNAAGGVTADIKTVDDAQGVSRNADGGVDIDMNYENVYITAHKMQHATLEFRYFNVDDNGFGYGDQGGAQNAWVTTGATIYSTTSNSSNMDVAAGATVVGRLSVRAIQTDTQFNSDTGGVLIGVNADIAHWDSVGISNANTAKITNADLTSQEQKLWSNYEAYFKSTDAITHDTVTYDVNLKAVAGSAPTKCPVISFAARGNYLGTTSGNVVLHSAAKDDSSYTNVYTVQTITLKTNACTASA